MKLLPILFDRVMIPPAVGAELRDEGAPEIVRCWMASPPRWLEERSLLVAPRPEIAGLDAGESEAIELALQLSATPILIGEANGRQVATNLRRDVRGTIGILVQAATAGHVNLAETLDRLEATSFHITPALRRSAMRFHHPEGTP
jgi:predicted nucleic acid-binding protein